MCDCQNQSCDSCTNLNDLLMKACTYKANWLLHGMDTDPDFLSKFQASHIKDFTSFLEVEKYNKSIEFYDLKLKDSEFNKKRFIAEWYPGYFTELISKIDKTTPGYIWHILWTSPAAIERAMLVLHKYQIKKSEYYATWIQSGNHLNGKFIDRARDVATEYFWTLVMEAEDRC